MINYLFLGERLTGTRGLIACSSVGVASSRDLPGTCGVGSVTLIGIPGSVTVLWIDYKFFSKLPSTVVI